MLGDGWSEQGYIHDGGLAGTENGDGDAGNPQDTARQAPHSHNNSTAAQNVPQREPTSATPRMARRYSDPVPDEPLQPQLTDVKDFEYSSCEEWPGFLVPSSWNAQVGDSIRKRRAKGIADSHLGLDQPWPLPYELLQTYIGRRAASLGVHAERPELVAWCTEQYERFVERNGRWCRKVSERDWTKIHVERERRKQRERLQTGQGLQPLAPAGTGEMSGQSSAASPARSRG